MHGTSLVKWSVFNKMIYFCSIFTLCIPFWRLDWSVFWSFIRKYYFLSPKIINKHFLQSVLWFIFQFLTQFFFCLFTIGSSLTWKSNIQRFFLEYFFYRIPLNGYFWELWYAFWNFRLNPLWLAPCLLTHAFRYLPKMWK